MSSFQINRKPGKDFLIAINAVYLLILRSHNNNIKYYIRLRSSRTKYPASIYLHLSYDSAYHTVHTYRFCMIYTENFATDDIPAYITCVIM